jgi:hypothetical protein
LALDVAAKGAAGATSFLGGLQSKQTNMEDPKIRLKEPLFLGLCTPHLMQLMVSPVLPSPSKGEPPFLDL